MSIVHPAVRRVPGRCRTSVPLVFACLVLSAAACTTRHDASRDTAGRGDSAAHSASGKLVSYSESAGTVVKDSSVVDPSCERGPNGANVLKVPQVKPGDSLAVNASEYDGWKMFHVYCYRCHGVDAMGSSLAPNLRHSVGPEGGVNHECFTKTVTNGRLPKGMPTWKPLLSPEQIENLWNYVNARSSGRLLPGRPHTVGAAGTH